MGTTKDRSAVRPLYFLSLAAAYTSSTRYCTRTTLAYMLLRELLLRGRRRWTKGRRGFTPAHDFVGRFAYVNRTAQKRNGHYGVRSNTVPGQLVAAVRNRSTSLSPPRFEHRQKTFFRKRLGSVIKTIRTINDCPSFTLTRCIPIHHAERDTSPTTLKRIYCVRRDICSTSIDIRTL